MPFATLITPQELLPHIEDPSWGVFDCRFDLGDAAWGEREYANAHIPAAVYLHLERDLSAPLNGTNGRHPLPSIKAMQALFSRLGIGPHTQVVAYDDKGGGFAARLWWMLRYLGHDSAAVLNGGWPAWLAAGSPTSNDVRERRPATFKARPRPSLRIDAEQILPALGIADLRLIDSRAPERYRGEMEPLDPVAGHIPGAQNRFWQDNLTKDGHFRAAHELRVEFDALLGELSPQQAVVYCGSGVTGALNVLAMTHAGLEGVRPYPGSWSEWCADRKRPMVSGEKDDEIPVHPDD
jgi:thiosulfate/3-mercaptopyruvate sulfurtransferase